MPAVQAPGRVSFPEPVQSFAAASMTRSWTWLEAREAGEAPTCGMYLSARNPGRSPGTGQELFCGREAVAQCIGRESISKPSANLQLPLPRHHSGFFSYCFYRGLGPLMPLYSVPFPPIYLSGLPVLSGTESVGHQRVKRLSFNSDIYGL